MKKVYHRSEVQGFILLKKLARDNTGYRVEKAVKERAILKEEIAKLFINGKNTVTVNNVDQFKRHRGSAPHGIEITAGRAETAVTAEGTNFNFPQ